MNVKISIYRKVIIIMPLTFNEYFFLVLQTTKIVMSRREAIKQINKLSKFPEMMKEIVNN